jgi:hypothetical protein
MSRFLTLAWYFKKINLIFLKDKYSKDSENARIVVIYRDSGGKKTLSSGVTPSG